VHRYLRRACVVFSLGWLLLFARTRGGRPKTGHWWGWGWSFPLLGWRLLFHSI